MSLPFAEAADQNKQVIFEAIRPYLHGRVLEIGSGTGQHAVYFAGQLPELSWQASDVRENLPVIQAWIKHSGLQNLLPPIELDVAADWPASRFDLVYTANCFHIMGADEVSSCFTGLGQCLEAGGVVAVYGPFNYGGEFTSASNAGFDAFLRSRDPKSGIRDFEWLNELAGKVGLGLAEDIEMPHNNRCLVWKKRTL